MRVLRSANDPGYHYTVFWAIISVIGPTPASNVMQARLIETLHTKGQITDLDVECILADHTEGEYTWEDVPDGECGLCLGMDEHHPQCIRSRWDRTKARKVHDIYAGMFAGEI